eukprot:5199529-Prymnesium_polylepis.1
MNSHHVALRVLRPRADGTRHACVLRADGTRHADGARVCSLRSPSSWSVAYPPFPPRLSLCRVLRVSAFP